MGIKEQGSGNLFSFDERERDTLRSLFIGRYIGA